MLKYYMWAVGEKALSYVPCGRPIYNGLGYLTTRTSKRRHAGCGTSYHLIRKARELTPLGGTILDFGTAWHHHDAFLLYLKPGAPPAELAPWRQWLARTFDVPVFLHLPLRLFNNDNDRKLFEALLRRKGLLDENNAPVAK